MDRLQVPPNIGEIAAQLMSNPQIMNIINGMNNNSSGQPPFTDRTQEHGGDLSGSTVYSDGNGDYRGGGDMGSADISAMLGRLMSDPQIRGLIGSLSGSMGQGLGGRAADLDGERGDRHDESVGDRTNRDENRTDGRADIRMSRGEKYSDGRDDNRMGSRDGDSKGSNSDGRHDGHNRSHIRAGSDRDRTALLCALKPYLGENRRRKIEGMLKILELVEFARTAHLLDNLLPGFIN